MAEDKVKITYESLFEMLRNERNREELQKLYDSFFDDVRAYIDEKRRMVTKTNVDFFSEEDRQKTSNQLLNLKRILRDLYEHRERKIVEMALNKSRTNENLIDTSTLLEKEKAYFEELTELFDKYRQNLFASLFVKVEKTQQEKDDSVTVRFLSPIPQFMGENLENYGPYDEEDIASLPKDVAKILLDKGRAEELD